MPSRRLLCSATISLLLLVPADSGADTTIAALPGPTAVRAWAGTAVLSVLDAATNRYALSVQRGTAPPTPVPGIAPAPRPFDADIGPGPGSAATIVYARCPADGRCHLYQTTPAGGRETLLAGAASTGGSESAPTVWGGRLAFARRYAGGNAYVYTRPLAAPATVRSTRLPGVPRQTCDGLRRCRTITDGTVPELELRRTTLAEIVHFGLTRIGICGEGQVRLVDVTRRRVRDVTRTTCGLSGSTWIGLSLDAAQLTFARICPGDPAGCQSRPALAYRYTLATRRIATARRPALLDGFAATDSSHALEVRERSTAAEPQAASLVLSGPLAFTATGG